MFNNCGFGMVDRHVGFEAAGTFSILKDLATFHAVPLAIRLKNPELFATNILRFCPDFGSSFESMKQDFDQQIINSLKEIPELAEFMDRIEIAIVESAPFSAREMREPWTSIMHLDCWSNNIMVTSDENPKNMILDLQVPGQGSVAADLIFFLLTSVKLDVVRERLDEFFQFYYDQFIENLQQLKVDTSDFKFDGLLEEIAKEAKCAEFAHSLGHSNMMLMDKGVTVFDASDASFNQENFEKLEQQELNVRQIERLRWISLEVLKRNWI